MPKPDCLTHQDVKLTVHFGRRWMPVDRVLILCDEECEHPGSHYIDKPEGRTIANDDWIRNIVLNIPHESEN